MAQHTPSNYTQGYSNSTISTHQLRTAESDAAFLLPHIKKMDHILDIGCGPGTITTSLAKYASQGQTIGVDISPVVLGKAKTLASESNIPTQGPGSVIFAQGNILDKLDYADASFDVVYCSQLFGHLPPPDLPLRALSEIRRVLKPNGILATRDAASQHFYPPSLALDRLWVRNLSRALHGGEPAADPTGTIMPALFQEAGFDPSRIRVGAGTSVHAGPEARRWLAERAAGQLREGDEARQSWLDAGITEEEIRETLRAAEEWAGTDGAWYASLQCEMLAWK